MKNIAAKLLLGLACIFLITPLFAQINDGGSLPRSFALNGNFDDATATPMVSLPDLDLSAIVVEDSINDLLGYKAPRFGVLLPVDIGWNQGSWSELSGGDRIWRIRIRAVGASATNFYFDDFYMPAGAKMHIFSPDHSEVIGGFDARNNSEHNMFSTSLIHGEEAIIEYYEPASAFGKGRIHISDVNHAYRMIEKPPKSTKRDFGNSDPCEVNVNCSPEGDDKTQQRDAVARILVRAGQDAGWCSGTLINNVRQDCTPYFLTALHCADDGNGNIVTQNDFNQWVFYFNYQAAGCTSPTNENSVPNNTITGANVRADSQDPTISTGSDLLLLEFQNTIPPAYNVFYAGWNRSPNASTGGFGIHHPAGDIKKVSTFAGTATETGWNQAGVTHWSVTWVATTNGHGVTEGGSSGSGLFDTNGRLIGSLSGGSSFCNSPNSPDSYGKMSYHWDQNGAVAARRLKDWLDPDNTGVMTLNGTYAPCQGNNNLDAGVSTIISPANATFVCDNPFSAQVTLKNFGMSTLTSVTINYKINNGAPVSQNWNGSLVQNATANVVLNNITPPGNGAFVLSVYTSNPNGMMDASPANDTSKANLQYLMSTNLPYAQDFAAGIPGNISISDPSSDGFKWKYNPNVNGFGAASGGGSLWLDNYNDNTSGTLDYAFLPNLSLAGQQNTQLQFDVAYAKYDDNNIDSLLVAVSSDCRNNFLAVYKKGGADLATAPDQTNLFIPTAMQWRTETIDLSAYDGNGNLSIVFINKGGWGQALYVDNIQINGVAVAAYQNLTSMQQFTNLPNAITNANPGETIQQINNAVEFAPIELPLGYIFDFQQPYTLEIKIP